VLANGECRGGGELTGSARAGEEGSLVDGEGRDGEGAGGQIRAHGEGGAQGAGGQIRAHGGGGCARTRAGRGSGVFAQGCCG
jgi:hypothetical protein